jgi:hypothetical protein
MYYYKIIKVVYAKIAYKNIVFIKFYLFAYVILHKLKNNLFQADPKTTYTHIIFY